VTETTRSDPSVSLQMRESIAVVTFSNPGKRNAFTWQMYDSLLHVAQALRDAEPLTAVVFRGNPEDGFAAGTDIRGFTHFASGADGVDYERRVGHVLDAVAAIPAPTIAAVERSAVGAGLAVAAMCDIIVAERNATFGAPIARTLGNCLPIGVVERLRSRMGVNRTMAMLMTAALIPAQELTACGFVAATADPGAIDEALTPILKRLGESAPLTLRALKEMNRRLDQARDLPDDTDLLESCYGSADFHEGVTAFLDHRRPDWSGR
jgi:enoyl-CoA hydratase